MKRVGVVGANGRVGRLVLRGLQNRGLEVVAFVRDSSCVVLPASVEMRRTCSGDLSGFARACRHLDAMVYCIPPQPAAALVRATPCAVGRLVVLGSARRFTRYPDARAEAVKAAEKVALSDGRHAIVLHPTMIYGGGAENNAQRIASLIRRCRIVPLPAGGSSLIQPIYIDDLVECLIAGLTGPLAGRGSLVVAGPCATPWADFVRAIARAIERKVTIVPVPHQVLGGLAILTPVLPGLPNIRWAEVRRLTEDKAFPINQMRVRLGVHPRSLDEGLKQTFPAV